MQLVSEVKNELVNEVLSSGQWSAKVSLAERA